MGQHVAEEGPDPSIVTGRNRVLGRVSVGGVGRQLAPFGHPLGPAAIEKACIGVTEKLEHPQGVGRPPVEVVAVEDHGRVGPDSTCFDISRANSSGPEIIAHDRIVEVRHPVDLDRARNVAGVIEQHVLVGFDDHQVGVVQDARPANRSKPGGRGGSSPGTSRLGRRRQARKLLLLGLLTLSP